MKTILRNTILPILVLCIIACCTERKVPFYFDLKNNSTKTIYDGFSYSYPDTTLKSIKNKPVTKTYPGRVQATPTGYLSLNATAQIFIFDADVIEKTPWDTIVKYDMYLKRYQFTESELKAMNWEIIYDGK